MAFANAGGSSGWSHVGTRKVRLADVAAEAGVSGTTASLILNGRAEEMRIARTTRERVIDAAKQLGYRPNHSARSLRTQRTKTIGVVSDFIASGHFASQMLQGAGTSAQRHGQLLVIGETQGDPEVESQLIREMLTREFEGVVYARLTTSQVHVPPSLRSSRVVVLNALDVHEHAASVVPNEVEGGRLAACALLDRGVADIAVVGLDRTPGATAGADRLQGVTAQLRSIGAPGPTQIPCDWRVESARDAMGRWLDRGHFAAGLICLNDRIGFGVYQALWDRGLTPPRDVRVVSFDGSELAGWLRPSLATVAIPYAEMGSAAVDLVLTEPGDHHPGSVARIPMQLVDGESLGP